MLTNARTNVAETRNHLTRAQVRTLKLRLVMYRAELETCTTSAMRNCVQQAISGVEAQLAGVNL